MYFHDYVGIILVIVQTVEIFSIYFRGRFPLYMRSYLLPYEYTYVHMYVNMDVSYIINTNNYLRVAFSGANIIHSPWQHCGGVARIHRGAAAVC